MDLRLVTLDSDVSDAAAIVTYLHVETAQHGEQLETEHAAIFNSLRHCGESSSSVTFPSHQWANGLDSPVLP